MDRRNRLAEIAFDARNRLNHKPEALAAELGVSTRTIYRDLATLRRLGVSIPARSGAEKPAKQAEAGPPILFQAEESLALDLAVCLLLHQLEGKLCRHAQAAQAKLREVMPRTIRRRTDGLVPILLQFTCTDRLNLDASGLGKIQTAIREDRMLFISYRDLQRDARTQREVEPMQLLYARGKWYLRAFCLLRKDIRLFRLERIERIRVRGKRGRGEEPEPLPVLERQRVRVKFSARSVRWVRERQFHRPVEEEMVPDEDAVVFTYEVGHPAAIKTWLLSWGAAAEVLSPAYLREEIRREARHLLSLGA